MKTQRINIILSVCIVIIFTLLLVLPSFAQSPPDYAYVIPLEFENLSGSNVDMMLPIAVNSQALIDLGIIATATNDYLFTDTSKNTVQGFVQDLTDNSVNWWSRVVVLNNATTTNNLFVGGPDNPDGFPVNNPTRNDAHVVVPDSATLRIIVDLDIHIDAEFENIDDFCGVLIDKTDDVETDAASTGYALYSFGQRSEASGFTPSSFTNVTEQYWDFTPDFDMYICGIQGYMNNTVSVMQNLRVIKGDLLNDLAFDTVSIFPLRANITAANYRMHYFDHPVFLESGIKHRFLYDCSSVCAGSTTTQSQVGAVGTFSIEGLVTHTVYGSFRTFPPSFTNNAAISYIADSTQLTSFIARINNETFESDPEVWNGTDTPTIRITYSSPTIDIFVNALNVGAKVLGVGAIGTNTSDVQIGRYFNGHVSFTQIETGVTEVLNLDYHPFKITQFQEGELANSWLWKGTITDDSVSTNDAQYFITADTTNINIETGALGVLPTPTPQSTPQVLAGIIAGADINPLHTPIPTVEAELPGKLEAPDSNLIQEAVFWLIFGFWGLTFIAGFIGRILSEYVMATIFTIGFGILSGLAGGEFLLWNVAFIGLGSIGMALIVHQGR